MQFSSDLGEATKRQLRYGAALVALLRQEQYHPYAQHEQVILLVAALGHVLTDVPTAQVPAFSRKLLQAAQVSLSDVCSRMDKTGKMTPDDRAVILNFAKQFAADNAPAE